MIVFLIAAAVGVLLPEPSSTADVCSMPSDPVPCDTVVTRYFYDVIAKTCQKFNNGECGGNGNNFESIGDCINECDFCNLEADTGSCKARMPKYFWNQTANTCTEFNYGGCDGNKNRFEIKEECLKACRITKEVCTLPKVVGPCRAAISRYFWNTASKKCENFSYGGCQGNRNNFYSASSCNDACKSFFIKA